MSLTIEKCLQAWTNTLRQLNAKADIVFFWCFTDLLW